MSPGAIAGSVQPLYVTNVVAETADGAAKRTTSRSSSSGDCPPAEGLAVSTIQAEGFPLGLFPNAQYEEMTIAAKPGDVLVFFSDGIVDAENAAGGSGLTPNLLPTPCPEEWFPAHVLRWTPFFEQKKAIP